MKIDSVSSSSQAMTDLLKLIASKSLEANDKLLKANIREQIKILPNETLGRKIDTYA
jgi:hypothetical protein